MIQQLTDTDLEDLTMKIMDWEPVRTTDKQLDQPKSADGRHWMWDEERRIIESKVDGLIPEPPWHPLTNNHHNAVLVDRMVSVCHDPLMFFTFVEHYCYDMRTKERICRAQFSNGEVRGKAEHSDRRRAIVLAALRAFGILEGSV